MNETPLSVVRACLQAYVDKDRAAIEKLIDSNYRFTSPIDNGLDRATYFNLCWPNSAAMTGFNRMYEAQDGARGFIVYEAETSTGKRFRNCEVHTVRDGKLLGTEVYFGWDIPHKVPPGAHAETDAEIRALLDSRVEACRAKDLDRLMSLYSPGIVYFDVVPPLRFVGSDAVRANFARWFNEYEGPIGLETRELNIAAGGDVAFAHMLHLDTGNTKLSGQKAFWVRSTVCCQRSNSQWLITHEHISLPVDFRSGTVLMDLVP